MICIPIIAGSIDKAISEIKSACNEPVDILELRLDFIKGELDIKKLLGASSLPCLVTCRPIREGGQFTGEENTRLEILQYAAASGAEYIDIELDSIANYKRSGKEKVICSFHDFEKTPDNLPETVSKIENTDCDIVKFAVFANNLEDNLKIWEIMVGCNKPVIGLCMGELGEVSRILALRMGGFLTFGSLAKGQESAPGQITARDMAELYNVKNITKATKLYAVVGNPIAHSVSPEIHNSAFRHLAMDATYLKFKVEDLPDFLDKFHSLDLQGISVTIPHKHAALTLSEELDPLAEKIGAVNTLTRKNGIWAGDNTDCKAALDAIKIAASEKGLEMKNANALVIGAGGAARGICYGLIQEGCCLTIANRTLEKAEKLASELGAEAVSLESLKSADYEIIANSTSVGMHPETNCSPVPVEILHKDMVAFDAIYNPRETMFLKQAREKDAAIADGVAMFVGQAIRQFEIWTGKKAPKDIMEKIVIKRLCGK